MFCFDALRMLSCEADNWRCRESVGLQVLPSPPPLTTITVELDYPLVVDAFACTSPPALFLQLPDMVALFDRDVVEFDVIPILQRLMKDPFSAGNPLCNINAFLSAAC